jgi:sugar/nucleoside kinase (ribokinase family)
MSEYDFIAIGDVTTDEFIQLKKENAVVNKDLDGRDVLMMYFGDKLEFEGAVNVPSVGNSPNAAVSAHRLGLKSAIITDIGQDEGGNEIIAQFEKEGLDTTFVRRHEELETNHHYVLRYGPERTILVKHESYPYAMPDVGSPKYLYFSSVGENSIPYHHEIAAYVKSHPDTKLAFQPGSFQIKLGYEALKDVYEACELFFCNKEEAQSILQTEEKDIKELLHRFRDLGPRMPVITDGPRGAYVFDGEQAWHMPMYPDPSPPVDRTGAGDSFSSTFTSMLALGKSVPEALERGPINSMSVVQFIGAQEGLLSLEKLEEHLKNAPEGYKAAQI